jgi:hypothetical protein
VRKLGAGKTRVETLAGYGIQATICPNISLEDGIKAVRGLLPTLLVPNLYNARTQWLTNAHAELDQGVAEAYGWGDDWRDGILDDDEILRRLFNLNQERAADASGSEAQVERLTRAMSLSRGPGIAGANSRVGRYASGAAAFAAACSARKTSVRRTRFAISSQARAARSQRSRTLWRGARSASARASAARAM